MRSCTLLGLASLVGWGQASPSIPARSHYYPRALTNSTSLSFPTSSSSSISSSASISQSSSTSSSVISSSASISESSSSSSSISSSNSSEPFSVASATNSTSNSTTPSITSCTRCALQVQPHTISFTGNVSSLSSITATVEVVISVIQYEDGNETVTVTNTPTLPENATVTGGNYVTAHIFTWKAEDGVTLTFTSGTTYLAYTNIFGGVETVSTPYRLADETPTSTTDPIASSKVTCKMVASWMPQLFPPPDGNFEPFIQSFVGDVPLPTSDGFGLLPPGLIQYLKGQPDVTNIFSGRDLATCTTATDVVAGTSVTSRPPESTLQPTSPPTFIETSYTETTMHIQRTGRLRPSPPNSIPEPSEPSRPQTGPEPGDLTPSNRPGISKPVENTPPGLPEIIVSAIIGNPTAFPGATQAFQNPGQSITIGNDVFPIHPPQQPGSPQQTQNPQNPQNSPIPPNPQNPGPGGVVIGTQTVGPGQTAVINGVVVSVPAGNGGSSVVVGGSTFAVNPAVPGATGPAVLTVGGNVVTANPSGQFVVGSQTLNPGGPAIVVAGTTLSLGPSGTVAVVNGATQILGNAPLITGAPAMTVNGMVVSATVVGGTTQFVVADGQTLTPGGILVVSGTTFSLPVSGGGSTVVVNGITQTLSPGVTGVLPVLTLNNQFVSATVKDGTTAFVIVPGGQTLLPGSSIVLSGTTFSIPASASGGSVIVINGVTSTLGQTNPMTSAAALTINGKTYHPEVEDGTTQYVIGPGTTLKPGEAITVSGTTFSLPASTSGSVIVVNGVTSTIGKDGLIITAAPALTINDKTYTAEVKDGTTQYVLGPGTTLKPGEAITVSGTTYSLDSDGTALVVNGRTSSIPRTPASNTASTTASAKAIKSSTTQRAPGDMIASGIGVTSKKGGAGTVRPGLGWDVWVEGLMIGAAGWAVLLL